MGVCGAVMVSARSRLCLLTVLLWLGGCASTVAPPKSSPPSAEVAQRIVVAPDGSDAATGDATAPWRTISKALSSVRPGGTVVIRPGTYEELITDAAVTPASPNRPITVTSEGTPRPVLKGLLWLRNPSYWTVRGLRIEWSARATISQHMVKIQGGRGWLFSDNQLSGAKSFAALLVSGNASDWKVVHNTIQDTRPANGVNQDHLLYVNSTGPRGLIEHNLLTDSPNGRAVKVGPPNPDDVGVEGGLIIRANTMLRNLGPSNVQLAYRTSNVVIERNIMAYPGPNEAAVTAYELDGSRNVIRNNLVWMADGGAVERGVKGLIDGGDNVTADPRFFAQQYGWEADIPAPVDGAPKSP